MYREEGIVQGGRDCTGRKGLYREEGIVQGGRDCTGRKGLYREEGIVQGGRDCTGRKGLYREEGIVQGGRDCIGGKELYRGGRNCIGGKELYREDRIVQKAAPDFKRNSSALENLKVIRAFFWAPVPCRSPQKKEEVLHTSLPSLQSVIDGKEGTRAPGRAAPGSHRYTVSRC